MATKKAASSKSKRSTTKSSSAKKSTPRVKKQESPVVVKEEIVEVVEVVENQAAEIDDAPVAKTSFQEKLSRLRPGALIAELLGTFVLAGAVMMLAQNQQFGTIGIALTLAILVVIFGVVSGAHLNPAITIAQWINRKVDGVKATAYIIAQVAGALLMLLIMTGFMSAQFDYKDQVATALEGAAGVTSEQINEGGGLEEFLKTNYGMTIDDAAGQLGVNKDAQKPLNVGPLTEGKEWVTFLMEITASIIFGLGVGYAVFSKKKSAIEAGLAVGIGLFAGLTIGGASVILNPAIAAAIGGFEWGGALFGAGAMTFWWPVFTYIFGTTIGMTIGFTVYRFILKDTLAKK